MKAAQDALELQDILQSIACIAIRVSARFYEQPHLLLNAYEQLFENSHDYKGLLEHLLKNDASEFFGMQTFYWQRAFQLAQTDFMQWFQGSSSPVEDSRFHHTTWQENPFSHLLSQQYLLAREHLYTYSQQHTGNTITRRAHFLLRQFVEALSPNNFLQTNPELMTETIQSQGKNLLTGLRNFLTDLEQHPFSFVIPTTDKNTFRLGENLAATPGKVIFRNKLMELIQYSPQTTRVRAVPLLMIPPWINKYYILDLSQENSFVRWLVQQGITVFMISWANPDAGFANIGLEDYLQEGPISAIEVIQKQMGVSQVNTLGFCIGGTLQTLLLAYYKARQQNPIFSASFLASLIDFSEPGEIGVFIDEPQIEKIEEKMRPNGYLEGHHMTSAFNALRANDLIWSTFITKYLRGQIPAPLDLLYWNADATNMPAKMHSQYLRWMYLQNDLIKPYSITLFDVRINVHEIDTPVFFISTIKDHIAPWQSTYAGFQAFRGKKQFLLGGSGHIAGIINPPCKQKYGFYKNIHTAPTAEAWLNQAQFQSGSWWNQWHQWLKKYSKHSIPAPVESQLPFPSIMEAPGSYILKK